MLLSGACSRSKSKADRREGAARVGHETKTPKEKLGRGRGNRDATISRLDHVGCRLIFAVGHRAVEACWFIVLRQASDLRKGVVVAANVGAFSS